MSSDYEEQRREIERILKEVLKKYEPSHRTLYYKMRNGKLRKMSTVLPKEYERMSNIVLDPNLEYAIHVDIWFRIFPSSDCIERQDYRDAAIQFTPFYPEDAYTSYAPFVRGIIGIDPITDGKDPINQLFVYKRLLIAQFPQHVYICPFLTDVLPYSPDPTSIFHGKYGIIALCFTLRDFILAEVRGDIAYVSNSLNDIYYRTPRKLKRNEELDKLWKQDPVKACDIDLLKSIIHDEIEEAEKLMKQYGIIRVAFPLD